MKVAVIILHFGSLETTQTCIASLYKSEKTPFSLIVINNMPEIFLPKNFTKRKITVINNKKNLGFAGGVNVGIRHALKERADAVLLLNNDTIIKKPFLKQLMNRLSSEEVGIVGPAIRFMKNGQKTFDVGGKINKLFWRTTHNEVLHLTSKEPRYVTYVSGCCMLIKKEVFKKIGLFDDNFFLYYEDADFCLRAKKSGFAITLVPSVVIDHLLSKSAGKMSSVAIRHLLKSAIYFGRKYATTPLQKAANRLFLLVQALLFLRANPKAALAITQALLGD